MQDHYRLFRPTDAGHYVCLACLASILFRIYPAYALQTPYSCLDLEDQIS